MKIGYPCINRTIGSKGNRTFRLKSYSEERFLNTTRNNLVTLLQILRYNVANNILFFRITSDLVPFASHPICEIDWLSYFRKEFAKIGDYIRDNNIRISMHPGQFTIINTHDSAVLKNSLLELKYHADVIDALGLDISAKIQIHVGGVYGDKEQSIHHFIKRYGKLENVIKPRIVIENDDRSYTIKDCLRIYTETGVPILFDVLHHELKNSGETIKDAITGASTTWKNKDGLPMVDYSHNKPERLKISHAESIDITHFEHFLVLTRPLDFDIMLEIKDKEQSAIKAVEIAQYDKRFFKR